MKPNKKYEVLTPDGFKPFDGIRKLSKDEIVHLIFSDNSDIKCSKNHLIKTNTGWKFAETLQINDILQNDLRVTSKTHISAPTDLFDLINVGEKKEYYTNNIISHNCEFLGSSGSLISGKKLKELVYQTPIMEKDGLCQYAKPIRDHRYALVADVARGRGIDYSAFSIIDITEMPFSQVAVYRNNLVLPVDYGEIIHNMAKMYNDALVLIETNDIGEQICDILYYEYEYINVVQTENVGNQGKKISQGFSGKKTDRGVRTTTRVKNIGCSILKMLVEQDQLIINDVYTIAELATFSKKNKSYEAEPGKHDDIVMGLVLFSWMSDQTFFKEFAGVNTLNQLRERTDEEIFAELTPFGLIDDGSPDEINFEGEYVLPEDTEFGF